MASTNYTDNCLLGFDSKYDFQGDSWEAISIIGLWFQVYMLCRVDRSIGIVESSDMDIPMTYASLD